MAIYLIRHGETDFNVEKRLQGQINSALTEKGLTQCYEAKNNLKNINIDLIISSPLERTKKLAEIINGNRNIPLIYDNRIMERSYGDLEGCYERDKEYNIFELWDIDINYSKNNVEPLTEFLKRISLFLKECERKYSDKNILLVTHSGNSIAANCFYNGIPVDKNFFKLGLKNCGIAKYL